MDIKELIEEAIQLLKKPDTQAVEFILIAGCGKKLSFLLWNLED